MTNQNLTEIIAVLDRSASMNTAIADVIVGFNKFIADQKEVPGDCKVTLVIFDDEVEELYQAVDIKDFPLFTEEVYFSRNMTALNDALGSSIVNAGNRYSTMPESQRPGKVIVFVSTDGLENASKEFSTHTLKDMIKKQTDVFSWEFIFTASEIDSYKAGGNIGVAAVNTISSIKGRVGTEALYQGVSDKVTQYRSGQVVSCAFTPEEKTKIETPEDEPKIESST